MLKRTKIEIRVREVSDLKLSSAYSTYATQKDAESKLRGTHLSAIKEEIIVCPLMKGPAKKGKENENKIAAPSYFSNELRKQMSSLSGKNGRLKNFSASLGESAWLCDLDGQSILLLGVGEKTDQEEKLQDNLRRSFATFYRNHCYLGPQSKKGRPQSFAVLMDELATPSFLAPILEGILLSSYEYFDYYSTKEKKETNPKVTATFYYSGTPSAKDKSERTAAINRASVLAESINIARDFVNAPPNELNSEVFSKRVSTEAKKWERVKVKVLGSAELKKEKMGMFLSVNNGSAYAPQLVHLTYTPKKKNKNARHIALVGKGLTFDTGGYSLKPPESMIGMKFDMAGAATMFGAFRAAVLLDAPHPISLFLGLTDNAVNSKATTPDSIVRSRKGLYVEIANTDAEGRLVLGDVIDYACSQKPDVLIDAATLTGACLVALGSEVCGLMGNNDKLKKTLLDFAKKEQEYLWELPIIDEFRKDLKSSVADLRNIGSNRFAGTPKAAAFLENFVPKEVEWAHLDIAGVADSQSHLSYCPPKGASGAMIRTLVAYLMNNGT